ncbi:hypothetical protein [Cupriavidus taiwanensis]|uniref:hypothetical protein n=1 Tax=Cupriavidus taiwanensis TaxID=164546 RepID=UPI000E2F3F93|nr:hypothetical protein [Cupriavidus taiwanensis]
MFELLSKGPKALIVAVWVATLAYVFGGTRIPIPRVPKDYEWAPPILAILLGVWIATWAFSATWRSLVTLVRRIQVRWRFATSPLTYEEAELLYALAKEGGEDVHLHRAALSIGSRLNDQALTRAATGLSARGLIERDRYLRPPVTLTGRGKRQGAGLIKEYEAAMAAELKVGDRVRDIAGGPEMVVRAHLRPLRESGARRFGASVLCEIVGPDGQPFAHAFEQATLERVD